MRHRTDRIGVFRMIVMRRLRTAKRRGEITDTQFEGAMSALRHNGTASRMMVDSGMVEGFDWKSIWEYIRENWVEILKVVLTIAVLFLENGPQDDS